jgi:hypothetical protein
MLCNLYPIYVQNIFITLRVLCLLVVTLWCSPLPQLLAPASLLLSLCCFLFWIFHTNGVNTEACCVWLLSLGMLLLRLFHIVGHFSASSSLWVHFIFLRLIRVGHFHPYTQKVLMEQVAMGPMSMPWAECCTGEGTWTCLYYFL